ncbi:hypothetical protein OS493_032736, partial [Desmophyllum pertusum]
GTFRAWNRTLTSPSLCNARSGSRLFQIPPPMVLDRSHQQRAGRPINRPPFRLPGSTDHDASKDATIFSTKPELLALNTLSGLLCLTVITLYLQTTSSRIAMVAQASSRPQALCQLSNRQHERPGTTGCHPTRADDLTRTLVQEEYVTQHEPPHRLSDHNMRVS